MFLSKCDKNALHKITVSGQGELNAFSRIVGSSQAPTAHHNIT